jgi:multidrug efflux pump subunit AcrA (membrane-fusion protein)
MITRKIFFLCLGFAVLAGAEDAPPKKGAGMVILDETAVKNLRLETVDTEETTFEETIFALGDIEAIPARRAVVASRVPGRIIELKATLGDVVAKDAEVATLESRQIGDPPPSIVLKAPIGGLVTESGARLGEPVDPDKALLEITDLTEVYATARVPEHLSSRLKPGAKAHIKVVALPDEKFEGEMLRFGTAADHASGTIDAVFRLPNAALRLRPKMHAEFSIVLGQRENVMSVPRSALQGDATGRFVYVKDSDPKMKYAYIKTPVVVGVINDRSVEILSGLLGGDTVVTRGAYALAFAGKGTVSLKEALDAAHGHEHNEDGSEKSAGQKAAEAATKGKGTAHGHDGGGFDGWARFFAATTGLLFVLLILALVVRRKPAAVEISAANLNPPPAQ